MRDFYLILGGHIFFQTLSAAVQLDLFTLLETKGTLTQAELETALKIQAKPMRILLLGLTSLGLIHKTQDRYSNSEISSKYLSKQSALCMRDIVLWQHFINYKPLFHFHEAMLANTNVGLEEFPGRGNTLYERLAQYPDLEAIFQRAMEQISIQANQSLVDNVDFSHVKVLVDVGGGNGTNLITLLKKNTHLKGLVFDSATVGEVARENIRRHGMEERIKVVTGDCFADAFPAEADGILFCHFFTIWSEQKGKVLLRKAYQALPPGGRAMIFNMLQHDDGSGPLTAAMGSPYFLTLATGEGMLYSGEEYESWFREAGFSAVQRQSLPMDHAIITGIKSK